MKLKLSNLVKREKTLDLIKKHPKIISYLSKIILFKITYQYYYIENHHESKPFQDH